jgi:hypothetical protein
MSEHTRAIVRPIVRRAVLELLADIGGRHNDAQLKTLLNGFGHTVAGRELRADLAYLAEEGLIRTEQLGGYVVAEIEEDGRDAAVGDLAVEGVHRHRVMRDG